MHGNAISSRPPVRLKDKAERLVRCVVFLLEKLVGVGWVELGGTMEMYDIKMPSEL